MVAGVSFPTVVLTSETVATGCDYERAQIRAGVVEEICSCHGGDELSGAARTMIWRSSGTLASGGVRNAAAKRRARMTAVASLAAEIESPLGGSRGQALAACRP